MKTSVHGVNQLNACIYMGVSVGIPTHVTRNATLVIITELCTYYTSIEEQGSHKGPCTRGHSSSRSKATLSAFELQILNELEVSF